MRRSLVVLLLLAGCSGDVAFAVDVRTDFVPGTEFTRVDVIVDGTSSTHLVAPGEDWFAGARVADMNIATGDHDVKVRLLRADSTVLHEREVRLVVRQSYVLTVVVTRTCAGIVCAAGMTCVAGQCADPACATPEAPPSCPHATCTTATDCPAASVACAVMRCASGVCLEDADSTRCPTSAPVCDLARGCIVAVGCTSDATCSDGVFCNGAERCIAGACTTGTAVVCEGGTCDEDAGMCHTCVDADNDGYPAASCGGTDCDDSRADVHPGATERCTPIDEDCDGNPYDGLDLSSPSCCGGTPCGGGEACCGGTCADLSMDVHNCGTCGHACPGGRFPCADSQCKDLCNCWSAGCCDGSGACGPGWASICMASDHCPTGTGMVSCP